nr:hypothetical protein [Ktedonobacteraceae bacterium]
MSQSLIAFDTNHIKGYVFGTSKLKEIRGASSLLDHLNRNLTHHEAEKYKPTRIYANGGSALFLIESDFEEAQRLGKAVQRLYREQTGNGASISYAIQPIPDSYVSGSKNIMDVEMPEVLELLRFRLRQVKDGGHVPTPKNETEDFSIAYPSHPFLATCNSCGVAYAEDMRLDNDDPDEPEGRYCRVCIAKRDEDRQVRMNISKLIQAERNHQGSSEKPSSATLWGHILQAIMQPEPGKPAYDLPPNTQRPRDFNIFRNFTHGKEYLGLIYADANGMGKALEQKTTLRQVQDFAQLVDDAVFKAMGHAICQHLPVQKNLFPFDVLLVGGDDIVMVTPADKAVQVAHTLAEQFHEATQKRYTLSVGVVLAPVKYPFNLQRTLAEEALKAAKKSGSLQNVSSDSKREQSRINFVVVTGNTSQSYTKVYEEMYREQKNIDHHEEFYATLRPYTLDNMTWLLGQLKHEKAQRLGRTKLHQMREAILKRNRTTTIVEALA